MHLIIIKNFLLSLPRSIKRGLVIFFDLVTCGLSVLLTFGLLLNQWEIFQNQYWIVYVISIVILIPLFITFGLYRAIYRFIGSAAFLSVVKASIVYSILFFSIFTIFGLDNIPRSVGVIQPLLLFFGVGIGRFLIRCLLGDIPQTKKFYPFRKVTLIYGSGSEGRQLANSLSASNDFLIKGFLDDDPLLVGSVINGVPVYHSNKLVSLINQYEITDVLLAIPSASSLHRREIISSLSGLGVRVRTLPNFCDLALGRISTSDLHDLDFNDLLGRVVVPPKVDLLKKNIENQVILVTGAGGSIGSEICRQVIKFSPKTLILIDISEHALYLIYEELKKSLNNQVSDLMPFYDSDTFIELVPCLVSVSDSHGLMKIFKKFSPSTVFHAAAYKHVPLVEQNPIEAIRNNVYGTLICAKVSEECNVRNFTLVSTDKAVRPTNVMGASKRLAELILQAMDSINKRDRKTIFSIVRFGNVLGSSGSVVPLFRRQIATGGPITLTHPEVTRYFMTIPEAAQLVIQSSSMAVGGDVFVLDMGDPVKIYDLAAKMIFLSGLLIKNENYPNGDIEIKIIGLRPGEKLYEELLIGNNPQPTDHPKIMKAHEYFFSWDDLQQELEKLSFILNMGEIKQMNKVLQKLVCGYQPHNYSSD